MSLDIFHIVQAHAHRYLPQYMAAYTPRDLAQIHSPRCCAHTRLLELSRGYRHRQARHSYGDNSQTRMIERGWGARCSSVRLGKEISWARTFKLLASMGSPELQQ